VNSEYTRQVTFGLSQEFGIARQVVGNYAHFWTWREQPGGDLLAGNLLIAVYLDPQDALFFNEPSKPVAVFSHELIANRVVLMCSLIIWISMRCKVQVSTGRLDKSK
jgi:hypothetical protein